MTIFGIVESNEIGNPFVVADDAEVGGMCEFGDDDDVPLDDTMDGECGVGDGDDEVTVTCVIAEGNKVGDVVVVVDDDEVGSVFELGDDDDIVVVLETLTSDMVGKMEMEIMEDSDIGDNGPAGSGTGKDNLG